MTHLKLFFLVIFVLVPLSSPCVSPSFAGESHPSPRAAFGWECWFYCLVLWGSVKKSCEIIRGVAQFCNLIIRGFPHMISILDSPDMESLEKLHWAFESRSLQFLCQHLCKAWKCLVGSSSGSPSPGAQGNILGVIPAFPQSCIHGPGGLGIPGQCQAGRSCSSLSPGSSQAAAPGFAFSRSSHWGMLIFPSDHTKFCLQSSREPSLLFHFFSYLGHFSCSSFLWGAAALCSAEIWSDELQVLFDKNNDAWQVGFACWSSALLAVQEVPFPSVLCSGTCSSPCHHKNGIVWNFAVLTHCRVRSGE